jgi:hypothetical protein
MGKSKMNPDISLCFFVTAIHHYTNSSVCIYLQNNIKNTVPSVAIIHDIESLKKLIKTSHSNYAKTHKTSFILSLDKYHSSKIMVGDKLNFDVSTNNAGEIKN